MIAELYKDEEAGVGVRRDRGPWRLKNGSLFFHKITDF